MMFSRDDVLNRIRSLAETEDYETARIFLSSPEAEPYDPIIEKQLSGPRIVKRSDIAGTWKSRLRNARKRGTKLYGCADLVRNLDRLPDDAGLVTCSFRDRDSTGLFWFEAGSELPVGFVIVTALAHS